MTYGELKQRVAEWAKQRGLQGFNFDAWEGNFPGEVVLFVSPLTQVDRDDLYAALKDSLPLGICLRVQHSRDNEKPRQP